MVAALVLNGTVGVGKSTIGFQVCRLLYRRGDPCAVIDLDALTWLRPRPPDDLFNHKLMVANLAAMWPNYERRGASFVVLPRVVESPDVLAQIGTALGDAHMTLCRLVAAAEVVACRLGGREVGADRAWALERTAPLATELEIADLDDFVVDNSSDDPVSVARTVLAMWDRNLGLKHP